MISPRDESLLAAYLISSRHCCNQPLHHLTTPRAAIDALYRVRALLSFLLKHRMKTNIRPTRNSNCTQTHKPATLMFMLMQLFTGLVLLLSLAVPSSSLGPHGAAFRALRRTLAEARALPLVPHTVADYHTYRSEALLELGAPCPRRERLWACAADGALSEVRVRAAGGVSEPIADFFAHLRSLERGFDLSLRVAVDAQLEFAGIRQGALQPFSITKLDELWENRRVLLSDSLFAFDRAFANVDTEMLPAMFLASELELRNVSLTVLRLPELDVVSTQRRAALDNMRRCEMTDVLFRCPLPTWLGDYCNLTRVNCTNYSVNNVVSYSSPDDVPGILADSPQIVADSFYTGALWVDEIRETENATSNIDLRAIALGECPQSQLAFEGMPEFGRDKHSGTCASLLAMQLDDFYLPHVKSRDNRVEFLFYEPVFATHVTIQYPKNNPLTRKLEIFDIQEEQYVTIFEEENPARQLFTGVSQQYQVIEIYGNSRLTNKVRLTYEAMLVNDRLETVILSGTLSPQFRPSPAPKPNCPEPFQISPFANIDNSMGDSICVDWVCLDRCSNGYFRNDSIARVTHFVANSSSMTFGTFAEQLSKDTFLFSVNPEQLFSAFRNRIRGFENSVSRIAGYSEVDASVKFAQESNSAWPGKIVKSVEQLQSCCSGESDDLMRPQNAPFANGRGVRLFNNRVSIFLTDESQMYRLVDGVWTNLGLELSKLATNRTEKLPQRRLATLNDSLVVIVSAYQTDFHDGFAFPSSIGRRVVQTFVDVFSVVDRSLQANNVLAHHVENPSRLAVVQQNVNSVLIVDRETLIASKLEFEPFGDKSAIASCASFSDCSECLAEDGKCRFCLASGACRTLAAQCNRSLFSLQTCPKKPTTTTTIASTLSSSFTNLSTSIVVDRSSTRVEDRNTPISQTSIATNAASKTSQDRQSNNNMPTIATPTQNMENEGDEEDENNGIFVVVGVVGALAGVLIIGVWVWLCMYAMKKKRRKADNANDVRMQQREAVDENARYSAFHADEAEEESEQNEQEREESEDGGHVGTHYEAFDSE